MTRRQALGLLLAALLLAGGRLVRERLLLGPQGSWREPLLWDDLLPPLAEEPPDPARSGPPAVLAVNQAPAESLTLLPGVGPVLAARIEATRLASGPFADPGDLQRVKGIGPKLASRLAPYLVFTTDCTTNRPLPDSLLHVAAPDSLEPPRATNGLSSCNATRR
jgi:hypothetical protein